MNIFITDYDPFISSQHLDDLRLNKMILETAQMLCTAYRLFYNDNPEVLYKDTHVNHPCSIWARRCLNNFFYLHAYWELLNKERSHRFPNKKPHLSYTKLNDIFLNKINRDKFSRNLYLKVKYNSIYVNFDFNCTEYKQYKTPYAYKRQLIKKWLNDIKPPKWTNREIPDFFEDWKFFIKTNEQYNLIH